MKDLGIPHTRIDTPDKASQGGEDVLVQAIITELGITDGVFLEVGAKNGMELSTAYQPCVTKGWGGLLIEPDNTEYAELVKNMKPFPKVKTHKGRVTLEKGETLDELLHQYGFDHLNYLSIDIDSYDYWIWASSKMTPEIVCIEYNGNENVPKDVSRVISYNTSYIHQGADYFGASAKALIDLGNHKGYEVVGYTGPGLSLVFIRKDQNNGKFKVYSLDEIGMWFGKPGVHTSTPIKWIYNPKFSWEEQNATNV